MGRITPIYTNFTAGEFSPKLEGRVDIARYFNSATTLENMLSFTFGGTFRRPGTAFAAEVKDSSASTRIIPFQFSTEQTYIIEFGDLYMRFYKDNGQILDGGLPYEIVSPYAEADLFDVKFVQTADIMYLVHPSYAPRKLTRTGDTAWTLSEFAYGEDRYPPFKSQNIAATTMDSSTSTVGASGTLTASVAYFNSDMVGGYFKVREGYVEVTGYTDTTHVSITVRSTWVGSGSTVNWAEGAFSDSAGYSSGVAFYEQRLYLGGTTDNPQTVWGSVTEDFENFDLGDGSAADDAVQYTIASEQVNAIFWLATGKALTIGTSGGCFLLDSGSSTEPVTASNVRVLQETTYGSANLSPNKIDAFLYYMQRDNRTLRELRYSFQEDANRAYELTLLADHITKTGIKDMGYQQSPYSMLWCVRNDGEMAVLTRQTEQEVVAWTRVVTDGTFESVAIIPDESEDQVWFVVNRTIEGATKRYVEYMKPFDYGDDQEDGYFVDSGLTYDGAAVSSISGLDHLEGETVAVCGDGAAQTRKEVRGGAIVLDTDASVVHVGLPYTSIVRTQRMEGGAELGTAQTKTKRIYKIGIRFFETVGCKFGTINNQDILYFRDSSMAMDTAVPLFTGDKIVSFPTGWNTDNRIYITQEQPLPMNILCIIPYAEVYDG